MATRRGGVTSPHATYERGHHRFEWGDPDRAIIEVEYVRDHRGEVSGEVSVTSTAPTGGLIHVARVNLLSTRSLSEFAGHVAKRSPETSADWQQLIGVVARQTVARFRRGEPAVLLRDVTPAPDAGYVLAPLLVARMPSLIFGDGGSAK